MMLLLAAVALVLPACVNVANQCWRARPRASAKLAVRAALGSWRSARGLLVESLLLGDRHGRRRAAREVGQWRS